MDERKGDHLNLAREVQVSKKSHFDDLNYEPMFCGLKNIESTDVSIEFLDKKMLAPVWISSMTGGTSSAGKINHNLAQACAEFGLGMGLGSCRILLENEKHFHDFNLRPIIGDELPFYANFGIAQIEEALKQNKLNEYSDLVESLKCDGMIVHVNPLQEWFQMEGDRYENPPIETIKELLKQTNMKIIVKEVGQGFGPKSLRALMQLPLAAIDFASFGGTNFTLLEMLRNEKYQADDGRELVHVGHRAEEMIEFANLALNELKDSALCKQFIISGGIKNYLEGFVYTQKLKAPCVYGQAKSFLEHATGDYGHLQKFVASQVEGIKLAQNFLEITE